MLTAMAWRTTSTTSRPSMSVTRHVSWLLPADSRCFSLAHCAAEGLAQEQVK